VTTQQIDDLSAYLIAGRVKARPSGRSETDERSPRQGIRDRVEAESIGFRRVFISERWNLKEASVLLGAVGALTSRVGLRTGLINPSARHPLHTAAVGSTLTAAAPLPRCRRRRTGHLRLDARSERRTGPRLGSIQRPVIRLGCPTSRSQVALGLLQIQWDPCHQAAIDDQVGPGDITRFVGHQP
jgi:Luciferase-like monooxygenase